MLELALRGKDLESAPNTLQRQGRASKSLNHHRFDETDERDRRTACERRCGGRDDGPLGHGRSVRKALRVPPGPGREGRRGHAHEPSGLSNGVERLRESSVVGHSTPIVFRERKCTAGGGATWRVFAAQRWRPVSLRWRRGRRP